MWHIWQSHKSASPNRVFDVSRTKWFVYNCDSFVSALICLIIFPRVFTPNRKTVDFQTNKSHLNCVRSSHDEVAETRLNISRWLSIIQFECFLSICYTVGLNHPSFFFGEWVRHDVHPKRDKTHFVENLVALAWQSFFSPSIVLKNRAFFASIALPLQVELQYEVTDLILLLKIKL